MSDRNLGQFAAREGQGVVPLPRFCSHADCAKQPGEPCLITAGLIAPKPQFGLREHIAFAKAIAGCEDRA